MGSFEHLVWALGHSLWIGAVAGVLLWAVLSVLPVHWARARYGVALAALVVVVFGVWVVWRVIEHPQMWRTANTVVGTAALEAGGRNLANDESGVGLAGTMRSSDVGGTLPRVAWTWYAGWVWLAGVGMMLVRMGVGLGRARLLLEMGRPVELPVLAGLGARLGLGHALWGRGVRALVSEAYQVPAVIGAWSPVVLVPAAILAEMSPEQLRLILAHELAHVRRWDYLVNLVQQVIEALLFFNPAVWWISRQVRVEREACCDRVAAEVGGDAVGMAQTLALVAERLRAAERENLRAGRPGYDMPVAALAVSGGGRASAVLERVRRLVGGSGRVRMVFPGRTLALALVVSAVVMAVMGSTAEVAVLAAEQILTPKERVEKMAELQQTLGERPVTGEEGAKVMLTGVVRTADGGPLPARMIVTGMTGYRGGVSSYSMRVDATGAFEQQVQGNRVMVWAEAPGYAPALSEVLTLADGKFPEIKLVVGKGFEGKLRLRDTAGNPLRNVSVDFAYLAQLGGSMHYVANRPYVTDSEGRVTIPNAVAAKAQVKVDAEGYQYDEAVVQIKEGEELAVTAFPAKKATGVVVDAGTGKPLAGAQVSMVGQEGGSVSGRVWYPNRTDSNKAILTAVADDQGRFELDRLRDDSVYGFWVTAEGHGGEIMQGVRAGEKELRWKLGPSRAIRLEIMADEGQMPKRIWVDNPIKIGNTSHSYAFQMPVVMKDGMGMVEFADPVAGPVQFYDGDGKGKRVSVMTASIAGRVVLDLRKSAEEVEKTHLKTREVAVKLDWNKEMGAEPRGKLRVDYIEAAHPNSYTSGMVALKDGEARVMVPVPTRFGYSQGEVAGYWIDDKHEIEVPEGDGPYVIMVKADPAGAIFGNVLDEKGKPFKEYFYVSLLTVKESPAVSNQRRPSTLQPYNSHDETGKYLLSPIPLEGVYRLRAAAGGRFVVSDEIVVDGKHPIQEMDLKFAEGVTVSGKVVGPDGAAMNGVEVELRFAQPGNESGATARTTGEGRFVFEHVDPKAGAGAAYGYGLTIKPGNATQGLRLPKIDVGGKPLEIKLAAGLTARGRLIDVETKKPMGGRRVTLTPQNGDRAKYPWSVETMTNGEGEFEARGLEPIVYRVNIEGSFDKGSRVLRDAAGKVTGVQGGSSAGSTVTGGEAEVVEIERVESPWR